MRKIMRRHYIPAVDIFQQCLLQSLLFFQIKFRRHSAYFTQLHLLISASAQLVFCFAQQQQNVVRILEKLSGRVLVFFDQTNRANNWCRVNCLSFSFIVEADISSGYRQFKKITSFCHSANSLFELPENSRFFRIPEIQSVRNRQWSSA